MSAHVHAAVSSPDGKYVFANDLGADKVFIYRYDPKANPELPLTAADPALRAVATRQAARVTCCSVLMASTPG